MPLRSCAGRVYKFHTALRPRCIQAVGASIAGTPIIDNATGELILDVTTPEARAYIELFRERYAEGILDKDFASISEMDFTSFKKPGRQNRRPGFYYEYQLSFFTPRKVEGFFL